MEGLNHIAFIMDGNSTWASVNKKPAMEGYRKGMETMANTIISAKELGIKYATFYAFSSENWRRPQKWVSEFMDLVIRFFKNDEFIRKVLNTGAKFKVIGDKSKLSSRFQSLIKKYEEETKDNDEIIVQIAISYGGRDEIVRTVKKMAESGIEFSEENISDNLDTSGVPDPQLIIRTSDKKRLSNFLLWQASYSEFYFSELLWPDFNREELEKAICEFSKRKRTYGG
ncbi:MAG: di-trans,poly-cis-decaprenylcistransferase [Holosporales bacterium]|jgi:undecaprenyl diphosphate synthase|nr:di-trans,poly-cis-decaprenylcistransferase [Holosporales bacterium]